MSDQALIDSMSWFEKFGAGLPLLAWIVVVFSIAAMSLALRHERRIAIHLAGAGVGAIALAGNLFDYFVTVSRSPDLEMEANPLWRVTVETFGLEAAKVYGLSGKILVSILAGQMFAFYLSNMRRLYPKRADTILKFARRLGNRSRNTRERMLALLTLFAFLFAGIQPLYFYVAFLNSIEDPERAVQMPSVLAVTAAMLVVLWMAFLALTYRAFRNRPRIRVRSGARVAASPGYRTRPAVEPARMRRIASK